MPSLTLPNLNYLEVEAAFILQDHPGHAPDSTSADDCSPPMAALSLVAPSATSPYAPWKLPSKSFWGRWHRSTLLLRCRSLFRERYKIGEVTPLGQNVADVPDAPGVADTADLVDAADMADSSGRGGLEDMVDLADSGVLDEAGMADSRRRGGQGGHVGWGGCSQEGPRDMRRIHMLFYSHIASNKTLFF